MDFPSIEYDEHGFRLRSRESGSVVAEMIWSSVGSIWVHKIDHFAYDVIAFTFCYFHEPRTGDLEVAEDFPGYKAFVAEVERRFPLREDWFHAVAFPAFVANLTCVWPPQR